MKPRFCILFTFVIINHIILYIFFFHIESFANIIKKRCARMNICGFVI